MSTHPLPVVVAGSRFGQFYAAGRAASVKSLLSQPRSGRRASIRA